jgi:hypothetical protein
MILSNDVQIDQQIDHKTTVNANLNANINANPKTKNVIDTTKLDLSFQKPNVLPEKMVDLYLNDLEVEGRTCTIDNDQDMNAILDLYHIDREVEQSKYNVFHNDDINDAIFKELYRMDLTVDHPKGKGDKQQTNIEFVDYITPSSMKQYVMQSNSLKQKSSIVDVFDLLVTDLAVEGHRAYHDAMADVQMLLKVDLEMSAAADLGYYNNALDEVSELLQKDTI